MSFERKDYVVGFLFHPDCRRVILIAKQRPTWQRGLLNGVGGGVEPGETPLDAMVREFREETGATVHREQWTRVAILEHRDWCVHFFAAFVKVAFDDAQTMTDEPILRIPVADLWEMRGILVRGLTYLIPLCVHAGSAASGSRLLLPVSLKEVDHPSLAVTL